MTNYTPKIINAMSVDVEDYFQVAALSKVVSRTQWDQYPLRVENNTLAVLDLFAACQIKATFFVLGWVAERCPALIREIVAQGHELASHGYDHCKVSELTPAQFKEDLIKSKKILEDLSGVKIKGFRAPSYSIGEENYWAFDVLQELGYTYSSSIYPIKHDLYGIPTAPRFEFFPLKKGQIIEIPITTVKFLGRNYPCGGGGFFRLIPYRLSRLAIAHVNEKEKKPAVFYFHPWEIDPEQPVQSNLSLKSRFRHYVNLRAMKEKLKKLLLDFNWQTMEKTYLIPHANQQLTWSPKKIQIAAHAD